MPNDSKPGAFASLLEGFGPLERVLLFLGFCVCAAGLHTGIAPQNRTLMIGTALLMAGLAGHHFRGLKADDVYIDGETVRGKIIWSNVFLAMVFSFLVLGASWFAYCGH